MTETVHILGLLGDGILPDPPVFEWPWPEIWIAGIEVTQAIQYYHSASHLTDPADRANDNAVQLVGYKPVWARVYVRTSKRFGEIPNVTGTLSVQNWYGLSNNPLGPPRYLTAQPPGTVTARSNPPYATERGTLSDTLNFVIPAAWVFGHRIELVARVQTSSGANYTMTIGLAALLRQTLRVAGIMVGYNGPANLDPNAPNLMLAPPTLNDLRNTTGTTMLMYPVGASELRNAGNIVWDRPLTDPASPGGCSPNWVALNVRLAAQKIADGNHTNVLYYGLLNQQIPMGPVVGCESGGVSSGAANDRVTMAHELGHACGLSHAPCGNVGTPDPNYPAYEPYDPPNTPTASIGEFGLNIANGSILPPGMFKDIMSYCGPKWISLYNYSRLLPNPSLNPYWDYGFRYDDDYVVHDPSRIPESDPARCPVFDQRSQVHPVVSILGVFHSATRFEVTSVMRLEAEVAIPGARRTELSAQIVDADGRILSESSVHLLQSHACSACGCTYDQQLYPAVFQALVPNLGAGAVLRIVEREKILWQRHAPPSLPRVTAFNARVLRSRRSKRMAGPAGLAIETSWQARSTGEGEAESAIQWSSDRRKNWYALGSLLKGNRATFDAMSLPSGRIDLRLLFSDGFHTTRSTTVNVRIPQQAPMVCIMTPRQRGTVIAGETMRLWGAVTVSGDETAHERANATWYIDGRRVGEGLDLFVVAPPKGRHRARLNISVQGRRS